MAKDFEFVKKNLQDEQTPSYAKKIDNLGSEVVLPVYKMRKIACTSLRSTTKLRLIYAYDDTRCEVKFIQFLELYAKGEKESEDRERIRKYVGGKNCLR